VKGTHWLQVEPGSFLLARLRWRWTIDSSKQRAHLQTSRAAEELRKRLRRLEPLVVDEFLYSRRDSDGFDEGDLAAKHRRETLEVVDEVVGVEGPEEDARDGGEREVEEEELCGKRR
jgi:hypothetical protein